MRQTVYTCLECGNIQVRKQGGFYSANIPTCHDKIMQSRGEEIAQDNPEGRRQLTNDEMVEEALKNPEVLKRLQEIMGVTAGQSNICPHCHREMEGKKQVGRCVYAVPCMHRLYQGRLKKGQ